MTVAAKGNVKPGPAVNDWKKYLIAALCLIALAALCLTVVSGQHYKTEEARTRRSGSISPTSTPRPVPTVQRGDAMSIAP